MNKSLEDIKLIAESEYSSIVEYAFILDYKLRIILINKSFIDVNISVKLENKFGFHWETKNEFKEIFRYDNFPDPQWSNLKSFPFHFHFKTQNNVIEPNFPKDLINGFRGFMDFVKREVIPETSDI